MIYLKSNYNFDLLDVDAADIIVGKYPWSPQNVIQDSPNLAFSLY